MNRLSATIAASSLLALGCWAGAEESTDDVQLRAMYDELQRARTLTLNQFEKPYFVQYTSSDNWQFFTAASLGGLLNSITSHSRQPALRVRVGGYRSDNTNAVFSADPRLGVLPVDDDYLAIREHFWLWTDLLYKASLDQLSYKQTALKEVASPDQTPDFAPAKPVKLLQPVAVFEVDQESWNGEIQRLSRLFASYPNIMNSQVRMRAIASTYRVVNTEGTMVRVPQLLSDVDIVSSTYAADGSRIWNHRLVTELTPSQLPSEEQLTGIVKAIAAETEALAKAPVGEDYSGPVLFEAEAAAEMMAQVLTDTVRLQRKPLVPSGANPALGEIMESVWASRVGSRVMPDWITLVDDPHQKKAGNQTLAGEYDVDDEGVASERVLLVDKGVLKTFLLSRLPIRTYNGSNGHGRLPGGFGNSTAAFGNLFVQVSGGVSDSQLKAKLVDKVKAAGLKYGIIIRRIDFPSTANLEELQAMVQQMQKSGFVRTLNPPLLSYRVYPDGHEELVRGLRFREFSAKDLRDISAASNRPQAFNYVNNGSALNRADNGSDATTSSVICPALLLESVELARGEGDGGRLPLVPSPTIDVTQTSGSTAAAR